MSCANFAPVMPSQRQLLCVVYVFIHCTVFSVQNFPVIFYCSEVVTIFGKLTTKNLWSLSAV